MRWLLPALLLAGCATAPPLWLRIDGKQVSDLQFEADQTACRGETQKANLATARQIGLLSRMQATDEVYNGCMAGRGYLQRNSQ